MSGIKHINNVLNITTSRMYTQDTDVQTKLQVKILHGISEIEQIAENAECNMQSENSVILYLF